MESKKRLVAVLDVGATTAKVIVAEMKGKEVSRILDRAVKPVELGRDVFKNGILSRSAMDHAIKTLLNFKELLQSWQVNFKDIKVIGTSALREARNRDTFLDRVLLRTGFTLKVVEGIEENHFTYLAVQQAMKELAGKIARMNTMIVEVGGGSTEVMLLARGRMAAAHSLRIGTLRMVQEYEQYIGVASHIGKIMEQHVRSRFDVLDKDLRLQGIRMIIAVGAIARLAAVLMKYDLSGTYCILPKKEFLDFVKKTEGKNAEDLVREFGLSYSEAEVLIPGLYVYEFLFANTGAEAIYVPSVSIREGVLLSVASGYSRPVERQFSNQVIASASRLAKRYQADLKHARHVAHLALSLFDAVCEEHGLESHERLLLHVAGLLHDIGVFISTSGHHKHGMYIVNNSEVFGFSRQDMKILGNIVRYHRKSPPSSSHGQYISLKREDRLVVMKLSAILRVADALDRGHLQRIRNFKVEVKEDFLLLHVESDGDISLERRGLEEKGSLFGDVFGRRIRLV